MPSSYLVVGMVMCFWLTLVLVFRAGYLGDRMKARQSRRCSERTIWVSVSRWHIRVAVLTGVGFVTFALWMTFEHPSEHLYNLPLPLIMMIGLVLIGSAGGVGRWIFKRSRRSIAREAQMYQRVETHVRRTLR